MNEPISALERAGQLERELAQAQAELAKQSELVQREWLSPVEAEGLRRELAAVTAERDSLKADAERFRNVLSAICDDTVFDKQGASYYKRLLAVWKDWCRVVIDSAREQGTSHQLENMRLRAELAAVTAERDALLRFRAAFEQLKDNAEEWECDGLGLWAQHGWWEAVDEELDKIDADRDGAATDLCEPISRAE